MDPASPLAGVQVVETADGRGADAAAGAAEQCGRLLADLGADVVKLEPPGGVRSRTQPPLHDALSVPFAVHNAGKRSQIVQGAGQAATAIAGADIWIRTGEFDVDAIRRQRPELVVVSLSPFGRSGPYRDWVATDWTLLAMGGVLSRSGLPGREPLMPPGGLALAACGAQAAWAALLAYFAGTGDHIDFSLYEATVQAVEPALGTVGTAQIAGYEPTRDRPAPGPYPIIPCRDGHVRIVLLTARQWHAMRAWLGEPAALQDPGLDTIRGRALASGPVHAAIEAHFHGRGKHELAAEGQARGVPVAPLLGPSEVLAAEHFRARGAVARREVAPGVLADLPSGWVEIDGRRAAAAAAGPAPVARRTARPRARKRRGRPLEGLRVLDFGVIVYGAEVARLFCEHGADVIKLESAAFPDGARVSPVSFAVGHRGSRSVGVNLRSPAGLDVVKRLIAHADVLLANFRPGTLERLGLGPEILRELNPQIVVVNASAVGDSGPWSTWMGYGPLVRSLAGLTSLWRYPDDPAGFGDSTIVHPDHFAARLAALAALAALVARERGGRGAEIAISQAETILTQSADLLAEEALRPGTVLPTGNRGRHGAPWGLYPCAGEDEWCAVTVRDDEDWRRLRRALGDQAWAADPGLSEAAGRVARCDEIDARLAEWTRRQAPRDVAATLQACGVPAGFMQRGDEYEQDPHLCARDFFASFMQPGLERKTVERAPVRAERIPAPELRPAPAAGEHTREVCRELLGMSDVEIEHLVDAGALEEPAVVYA